MRATGIVRRIDDLGRVVIPKEIRRTLRIREGDPLLTTLTPIDRFCIAIHSLAQRITAEWKSTPLCRISYLCINSKTSFPKMLSPFSSTAHTYAQCFPCIIVSFTFSV